MDVDYAMLVKEYSPAFDSARRCSWPERIGRRQEASHGRPERCPYQHLLRGTIEPLYPHGQPSLTRITNAFSKRIDKHVYMLSLYFCFLPHP